MLGGDSPGGFRSWDRIPEERELWEYGPFFSHPRHGLSSFALPCALAVMGFLDTGLKAHPVVSWNLQTFSLCKLIVSDVHYREGNR